MKQEQKSKFQNIYIITFVGSIFGLLYYYLFYNQNLTNFIIAGVIGLMLGVIIGTLEQFVLASFFKKKSFLFVTFIRTILYSLITVLVLSSMLSINIAINYHISYPQAWIEYLTQEFFMRDVLFSTAIVVIMLFNLEIVLFIGKANFIRLVLGWYHQPSEVSRIFMFVDLKGATTIAERLNNKDYSTFVRDYFYDISDAIALYGGEVYQYVGDEIVVVWKLKKDNSRCIQSFFKMQEIIAARSQNYLDKFGFVPEFKAGIHCGKVIATQVGKLKKELVYHGDVMNTTSRIEGQCNALNESLLISDTMKELLSTSNDFSLREKGSIALRGKSQDLILYGVSKIK